MLVMWIDLVYCVSRETYYLGGGGWRNISARTYFISQYSLDIRKELQKQTLRCLAIPMPFKFGFWSVNNGDKAQAKCQEKWSQTQEKACLVIALPLGQMYFPRQTNRPLGETNIK